MDQGFHLRPNLGIALDLGMRLHEDAVISWIPFAVDRIRFVVEAKISDDVRACRIGSADLGLAMEKPLPLIEVYGLGYVGGNDLIILARLGDTVHLNGEQHGNAFSFQFPCQCNGFRSAPAMSV